MKNEQLREELDVHRLDVGFDGELCEHGRVEKPVFYLWFWFVY